MNGLSLGRLMTVGGVFAVLTLILTARIGYLQLVEHERYRAMANAEHWGVMKLEPHRGAIRDRHGNLLAASVTNWRVLADPSKVKPEQIGRIANTLAPLVNQSADKLVAALTAPPLPADPADRQDQTRKLPPRKVVLAEGVPYSTGPKIEALGFSGIELERQSVRVYPEGNLAAQVIGIVGRDQRGLAGVEADYNRFLAGETGRVLYERDTTGAEIPLGMRGMTQAIDGSDVVLTLDRYIQRLIEQEADAAMARHKAEGVTIIVMNPQTGEILAMTTRPSFDLTKPNLNDPKIHELIRNRAITDMYEPGSVFKIITMAMALEEKLVTPTTTYVDRGWVRKWDRDIVNWDGAANGTTTMTRLLVKSANVGAVWLSDLLGSERFYRYVYDFGFGRPTNIDLSGEASGQARTQKDPGWSPFDLATNSFGQGINVTPIQLITAVSAIANGGKLMQPHVVKQIVGPSGTRTFEPVVVRRVISEETSKTLRTMMVDVVNEGTTRAVIPGYRLAGKTGTTQVVTGRAYSDDQTIASFVVFPAENPPFVVLTRVDRPKDSQWGGQVAAPMARTIVERLLAYYRIPPDDPKLGGLG
ncbi:MAG: penicillin-binding protein 2 [Chloroflexota bacterium]|nr:penicillin-binding protein 2 [Dehalococcoidia bacterium]MDW8253177.1 penicillin-binding protein 2 [Chloroflexota bacterium]